MELILKILGGALGIVVPMLFVWTLRKGIAESPFDAETKSKYGKIATGVIALWAISVWAMSLAGVFSYQTGDTYPRFVLPMVAPVLIGVGLLANQNFRTIINHIPLSVLVGAQAFRFAGAALLLVVYAGILPPVFSSGGYGDIVTASLALVASIQLSKGVTSSSKIAFWAFTLAGLGDLSNVGAQLLNHYPIWNQSLPSSAPIGDFSLVMLPALAVPFALMLHVYSIRAVLKAK